MEPIEVHPQSNLAEVSVRGVQVIEWIAFCCWVLRIFPYIPENPIGPSMAGVGPDTIAGALKTLRI